MTEINYTTTIAKEYNLSRKEIEQINSDERDEFGLPMGIRIINSRKIGLESNHLKD